MEIEKWKPVLGYEDHYEVSNYGNVRIKNYNCKCRFCGSFSPERGYLKKWNHSYGYKMVKFHRGIYKNKSKYVHRLVAESFIPNPENKPFVDHIDGDTSNCFYKNLRWCTPKENSVFAAIMRKNVQ